MDEQISMTDITEDDIEHDVNVKMDGKHIGTIVGYFYDRDTRKGEGLCRITLTAEEVEKLHYIAKTMNKTNDEIVEMFVRANLMGVEIKNENI